MPGCAEAESRLGKRLPASVRSLYVAVDGVFDSDGQWWVVWPRAVVEDMTFDEFESEWLPA